MGSVYAAWRPVVGLEAIPGRVFVVDVVIDADGLDLLVVVARVRDALAIGAAVSVVGNRGRAAAGIERAAENGERRAVGIAVERKHFLIEGHRLRRRLINRSGDGVGAAERKLLQDVILKCWRGNRGGCDDGQGDANPLAIEEEKQFVVNDGAANAAAEMVHRRARLVISRRRIGEIVCGVESGTVP